MTTNITVSLSLEDNTPTPNDIQNAVRRALSTPTIKDQPLTPSVPLISKGVKVRVRHVKAPKARDTYPAKVRAFARSQGLPVGDRGRVSADLKAAYDATL